MIEQNRSEFEKSNILKWHEAGFKGKGATIVVLDMVHKPFPGTDVIDPFEDNYDEYGHKSNVAQVIREVAPEANIVVFTWNRSRKQEVVNWIKEHESEIDAINCSFISRVNTDIFEQLADLDIPVFIASGNDYKDSLPSTVKYDWAITVGAWEEYRDGRARYSNYGEELDIVAYTNIYITTPSGINMFNGTSCAVPKSTGMYGVYSGWLRENGLSKMNREDGRSFVLDNAIDKDEEGFDVYSGHGLFILPNSIPEIKPIPETEEEQPEPIPEEGGDDKLLVAVSDGHGMETAGKRTPLLPSGMVMRENEFNRAVKRYFAEELKRCGIRTLLVAEGDRDVPLAERTNLANVMDADIYISFHANAYDGVFNSIDPKGVETYHYPGSVKGKKLADAIHRHLVQGTPQINRGVKSANFHELRETKMPAVLVEAGFMDNLEEAMLLLSDSFRREVAKETAKGVCEYFNIPYIPEQVGMKIASSPSATIAQMKEWARGKGAKQIFIDLADMFYSISVAAGVNPIVTYCQSAKETGYMKFGGVLDASFNNPCGLKTTTGGSDTSQSAHQRFVSWEQGIQAQVDHLALYAGVPGFPKPGTPDPRHFPYLFGTSPTVESLGGKWAPSTDYGKAIVRMVKEVQATAPLEEDPSVDIDLVDITLMLHGNKVVTKGIFNEGLNYIPVKFLEELGYMLDGKGTVVNVEYNKGGVKI